MSQEERARLYPSHLQTCRQRADQALAATGYDALIVHSGYEHVAFLDDIHYPFKANPHFKAWLPLDRHPDCWLIHRPGEPTQLLYYQPRDFWHMPAPDPSGYWTDTLDVQVVRDPRAILDRLPAGRLAAIGEGLQTLFDTRDVAVNPQDLLVHLHWFRARKTAYELECMRDANRLAAPAHRAAREAFLDGASEFEIHLAYCRACSHTDEELPYPNIIGCNEHAAVLHYQHREREPLPPRSLLVDAGAQVAGYASDITRTWYKDEGAFADLVQGVDALQQKLCSEVRAGVPFADLHRKAHQYVGRLLHDLSLIRLSGDDAASTGLTRFFLPHGLGHLLGVQVHDVGGHLAGPDGTAAPPPPDYPKLRTTRTLEEDMVITVEPGVYFIELLLDELRSSALGEEVRWEQVRALIPWGGVRIEDDVRVTALGHENLTREPLPEGY